MPMYFKEMNTIRVGSWGKQADVSFFESKSIMKSIQYFAIIYIAFEKLTIGLNVIRRHSYISGTDHFHSY